MQIEWDADRRECGEVRDAEMIGKQKKGGMQEELDAERIVNAREIEGSVEEFCFCFFRVHFESQRSAPLRTL